MKHAALPLLLFLCRCRQRKVNEIVKLKFLAGTTRCQTTNNSSCGLLVVYSSCCLGLYIFVKGFRRANKQRGLYPRELTCNGIEKRFETSHGIADQNTFWVLNKASKRHKKIEFISVHLEMSLYPEGLDGPTGGGGGEGGGEEAAVFQ